MRDLSSPRRGFISSSNYGGFSGSPSVDIDIDTDVNGDDDGDGLHPPSTIHHPPSLDQPTNPLKSERHNRQSGLSFLRTALLF
jgi:hypothetical protein